MIRKLSSITALTFALLLAVTAVAFPHAVVYPKASTVNARERYTIRVPNERAVPTTRVEITFPADVRVSSFAEVPGWKLEIVRDSAQRIAGAVWTGSLPPEHFAEFSFIAANPKTAGEIHWPVIQTYADGERAEWTGPAGSQRPASVTTVAEAAVVQSGAPASSAGINWISVAALGLAVISLGLSLRPRASR